jgi:hypothetical protein
MIKFPHEVLLPTDASTLPGLYADISEAECFAIGRMTTGWAILEHAMMATAIRIATEVAPATRLIRLLRMIGLARHPSPIPKNFANLSFETRFRVFRQVIKSMPAEPAKQRLGNIASRIANFQAERNDLTHGLWNWTAASPGKITVDHVRKRGRRRHKRYDSESMLEFADRIAQVNFALCYPGGAEEFFERKAQSGGYMSRRFLASISSEDLSDPTLGMPNAPLPPELQAAYDRLMAEASAEY